MPSEWRNAIFLSRSITPICTQWRVAPKHFSERTKNAREQPPFPVPPCERKACITAVPKQRERAASHNSRSTAVWTLVLNHGHRLLTESSPSALTSFSNVRDITCSEATFHLAWQYSWQCCPRTSSPVQVLHFCRFSSGMPRGKNQTRNPKANYCRFRVSAECFEIRSEDRGMEKREN
jgi:hypothetical protein